MKIRAVLDTNILVAGLTSRVGASFRLIEMALSEDFELVASPALWLEYEAVLQRDEIRQLHGLSSQMIDDILNGLAGVVIPVKAHFLWRPQLRDADDELVLEAAVNGGAQYLVTCNVRDFVSAVAQWKIQLSTPGIFLQRLEKRL